MLHSGASVWACWDSWSLDVMASGAWKWKPPHALPACVDKYLGSPVFGFAVRATLPSEMPLKRNSSSSKRLQDRLNKNLDTPFLLTLAGTDVQIHPYKPEALQPTSLAPIPCSLRLDVRKQNCHHKNYQDCVGGDQMNIYCSIKVELNKEGEMFLQKHLGFLGFSVELNMGLVLFRTRNEFKTRNINHKTKIFTQRECTSFKQLSAKSEGK